MAVKFIHMTETDFLQKKLIHKNCSLENCLDLLKNNHIWFANPEKWHDPFESMFLTTNYKLTSSGITKKHPWHQRVFGTCMTETATCEAYWNIYSQQQIGMSLAIDREVLLNELKNYSSRTGNTIYIGKVEYQKTSTIVGSLKANPFISPYLSASGIGTEEAKMRLLLLKRSSYRYEDEIRIFIVKKKKMSLDGIYMDYGCPPTTLITTITIDPNVKENVFLMIRERLINQYHFVDYSPNNKRVRKSLLYTAPKTKMFNI